MWNSIGPNEIQDDLMEALLVKDYEAKIVQKGGTLALSSNNI